MQQQALEWPKDLAPQRPPAPVTGSRLRGAQPLSASEITAVASYIYTLRGTHPANPKPPENTTPVKTGPNEFE